MFLADFPNKNDFTGSMELIRPKFIAVLCLTVSLLAIAFITPFTLPKIIEMIQESVSESSQAIDRQPRKPDERVGSCKFNARKTVVLGEQRFLYCQLTTHVNATMAREICEQLNSRYD